MTYNVDQFLSVVSENGGMARSNLYLVTLPPIPEGGIEGAPPIIPADKLNILCKATQVPGRQLLSTERKVGMETSKIAYGYQTDDVTLTFHITNDYLIRKYFDQWQRLAVNSVTQDVGYFKDYARQVTIKQIRKGIGLPIYKLDFPDWYLEKVPSNVSNRLPKLPWPDDIPFSNPIDLQQGQIDFALVTPELVTYSCELFDAYPTSMASVDLSNDLDGLIELTVQLSYRNWLDTDNKGELGKEGPLLAQILAKLNIF